jgi:hypothetical protein
MAGMNYKVKFKKPKTIFEKTTNCVTSCMNCKFTCHSNCIYENNVDKDKCVAMDGDGFCQVCPMKCSWKSHHNDYQIVKTVY